MLTIERASEIVASMPDSQHKSDLFAHFVDVFGLFEHQIITFAKLCGFLIAADVVIE